MIELVALDIRDYVYLFAGLVLVYVVYLLRNLSRIKNKRRNEKSALLAEGISPWTAGLSAEAERRQEANNDDALFVISNKPESSPVEVSEVDMDPVFAKELARSKVDLEVQQLRREVEKLSAETRHIAEELRYLKTARNVSPQYGEAMTLAQQGVAAEGIADRCGISFGEAELVAALARSSTDVEFNNSEDDRDDRYTDSAN